MWFGAKIARALGRGWLLFLEILAPLNMAVASLAFKLFKDVWPAITWPLGGVLLVAFVAYVSKSQAEQDRKDKEDAVKAKEEATKAARRAEQKALRRYKRDASGNLARLLRTLIEETNHTLTIQTAFLVHAVDIVKDYLELDGHDDRIAATWVVPVNGFTQWETIVYDKNRAHRQPGTRRDMKPGIPGATEAFLTGKEVLIPDTTDPKVAQWFQPNPPYRSILSVPARTMNMKHGSNVLIEGNPNTIVGVLNIDSTEPNLLREDVSDVVQDIAYLLAILEFLGGGHADK
jgi:hypothetical protein